MKNKIKLAILGSVLVGSLVALPVFAQGPQNAGSRWGDNDGDNDWHRGQGMMMHGTFGTVSSVNGNTQTGPVIQGNGQPVVGGTVSAISGSSVTITNKSNVTYTIDASSAVVAKNNATSSVSEIAVGDNLIVQGAVNGNSITASSILDHATPNVATNPNNGGGIVRMFVGRIGGFFHSLFGFF